MLLRRDAEFLVGEGNDLRSEDMAAQHEFVMSHGGEENEQMRWED
jgi:hypothetical protein